MGKHLFEQAELRQVVQELLELLAQTREPTAIYLVGGSAIALGYFDRRVTGDFDARLKPADTILKVAKELALKNGWQTDWLNDAAKGYIPLLADEKDWVLIDEIGEAKIFIGSAELLLAMKLDASRLQRDSDDIEGLIRYLNIRSFGEAEAIFERFNPGDAIPANGIKIIQSILGEQLN